MLKVAFGTVGVLAMAVLVGCAGTPTASTVEAVAPAVQYTFQDPDDVPQEKWSQAMRIARAMDIEGGLKDVVAPEGVSVTPQGEAVMASQGADPLVGGVLGAASPTTHVSSGTSLALGAAFFLLGSGGHSPTSAFDQVAFWVPTDIASSAEEASEVAAAAWRDARVNAFATKKFSQPMTSQHPKNHNLYYGSFKDDPVGYAKNDLLDMPISYSGSPKEVHVGAISGAHYGPIYIVNAGFHTRVDKKDSGLDYNDYYHELAKFMPEWSAVYFAPKYAYENRQRVLKVAPTVIHNGEVLHFIVPTQ